MKKLHNILIIIVAGILVYSCANKAQGPTGGPKDTTPPQVMKSTPQNGTLNFKKKEIQIVFDENITLDKVSDNVVISPPQLHPPDVKANARILTVGFDDKLIDSTTYTINFGNAVVDLNEHNPLKNFRFAFSTGDKIDTLQISGTVINAEDMNPVAGATVGIYVETDDSVFFKKPFLRIAKTDESGHFTIDNIKPGTYKIFALGDANRDYYYQPGEQLAFQHELVTPTTRIEEMHDTIWEDSVHVDSVRTYMGTRFLPDDIIMRYFKEEKKRQYLVKQERKENQYFTLYFNAKADQLPVIKPINFEWENKYLLQKNATKDTLTYWITDSLIYQKDTLQMTVSYLKTDSLNKLVPATDTITLAMRKARINPRAKRPGSKGGAEKAYSMQTNIGGAFDVFAPITVHFDAPMSQADLSRVELNQKIDTIVKPLPVKWRQVDSTQMSYSITYKWEPDKNYELRIDSAAFRSIYGLVNNRFNGQFKIKSLDEYSAMKILLVPFNQKAMIQVVDTRDAVMATKPAAEKGTKIEYLKPGDYYIRMFIDENSNGKWDTGDLTAHRQPEEVYYYPKKLKLMANWEFEETWDYKSTPVLQQKAAELQTKGSKRNNSNGPNY